jgi:hypothetical protein
MIACIEEFPPPERGDNTVASRTLAGQACSVLPKTPAESPTLCVLESADLRAAPMIRRWERLADEASEPNPFFEHWSLLPAVTHLDHGRTPRFLCLQAGERLLGLMPVSLWWRYYRHPLPHLANWVHGNAFVGTPLIAAGHEKAFWRTALATIDGSCGPALFAHFTYIPTDGPVFAALQDVAREQHRPFGVVLREERALLRSGLAPEDYLAGSLTAKKRKELRRQARRLGEEGDLGFELQRDDAGLDEWTRQFLALEAAGWKGDSHALARDSGAAEVFAATLQGAAARGKLERLTLRLDGRPIAMLANLVSTPGAFAYKTTYDERFAQYSPGVLLQQHNLALLDRPDIDWCDSCAAEDHPMINRLWRERRPIARINIGIGGRARRALYTPLLNLERGSPA